MNSEFKIGDYVMFYNSRINFGLYQIIAINSIKNMIDIKVLNYHRFFRTNLILKDQGSEYFQLATPIEIMRYRIKNEL